MKTAQQGRGEGAPAEQTAAPTGAGLACPLVGAWLLGLSSAGCVADTQTGRAFVCQQRASGWARPDLPTARLLLRSRATSDLYILKWSIKREDYFMTRGKYRKFRFRGPQLALAERGRVHSLACPP